MLTRALRSTRAVVQWWFAVGLVGGTAWAACPQVVRVTFFDAGIPPIVNGGGMYFETPPGLLVEWVQQAVRRTGCDSRIELRRRPVQRGYRELEYNATDLLALAAATPSNREKAAYPAGTEDPSGGLGTLRTSVSLWVRKGDTSMRWDGRSLQGLGAAVVGVPVGTVNEELARQQQWPIEAQGNGPQIIAKLLAGRFPVVLIPDGTVATQPDHVRAKLQRLGPPLTQTWYFSPASHAFQAAYPDFVQRYWVALCQIARADARYEPQRGLPACARPR